MAEPIWIHDIWLTANQWEVIQEALSQRRTKAAKKVAERIWAQLVESKGYQRHCARLDGPANAS